MFHKRNLTNLRSVRSTCEEDLKLLEATVAVLINSNSSLREENAKLNAEVSVLESNLSNLQTDVAASDDIINNLNLTIEDLRAQLVSLINENNKLQNDLNAEKAKVTILTNDKNSLTAQLNSANSTISSLNSQVTTLTNDKNKLQADLNAANSIISSLNSQVTTLTNDKNKLQADLNAANSTISSLNSQVTTLTNDKNKLQADLNAANSTISSLNYMKELIYGKSLLVASKNLLKFYPGNLESYSDNIGNNMGEYNYISSQNRKYKIQITTKTLIINEIETSVITGPESGVYTNTRLVMSVESNNSIFGIDDRQREFIICYFNDFVNGVSITDPYVMLKKITITDHIKNKNITDEIRDICRFFSGFIPFIANK